MPCSCRCAMDDYCEKNEAEATELFNQAWRTSKQTGSFCIDDFMYTYMKAMNLGHRGARNNFFLELESYVKQQKVHFDLDVFLLTAEIANESDKRAVVLRIFLDNEHMFKQLFVKNAEISAKYNNLLVSAIGSNYASRSML